MKYYWEVHYEKEIMKIPKNNVLLYGPTGCGKTYILQKLAELMNVPFHIADASLITEASYKGNDIEGVISGLYQAAGKDIKKTEKGIIFLDEFDKLSSRFKIIENNDKPTAEDFVKYGFVRELIGRLPAIVGVEALTIQDLIDILEKAEGSIVKKYVTVFDKLYNVKLEFTKEAIEEIAKQAYNKGIGARGLNSIVGDLVQELMYEAPSNPAITGCCITAEVVKKIAEPQIIYYEDER